MSSRNAIRIGKHEENLLIDIHDMVFVDVDYIRKKIYVHEDGQAYEYKYVMNKLRRLVINGYLESFPVVKEGQPDQAINVYTLGEKGVEAVQELLGDAKWDKRWTKRTPIYIYHALKTAMVRAAFETKRSLDEVFHRWVSERDGFYQYGQNRNDVIRPDGILFLHRFVQDRTANIAYFCELERSRQRPEVSVRKLQRYNEYCRRKAYQKHDVFYEPVDVLRVMFISRTENEMNRLIEHTQKVLVPDLQKRGGAVLYSTYDRVLSDPYGPIWKAKDSADPDRLYRIAERIRRKEEHAS